MYQIFVVLILLYFFIAVTRNNIENFSSNNNNNFFRNKVILITGSSKGIGFSLAKKLSRFDCVLVINGRDRKRLEKAQNLLSGNKARVDFIAADLSHSSNIDTLFEKIIENHGRIDILVNNVISRQGTKKLSEKKFEDWKKEIDVNVNSIFNLTQKTIEHMSSKDLPCKIINISSILAKHRDTSVNSGSIILSKSMIERMSEILSSELFDKKISVTVIRVDSGNFSSSRIDTKGMSDSVLKTTYESLNSINDFFYDNPDSVTSMFLDIIKLPHHQLSGKIYSTSAFKENKELSKIVPSYQIMLNKNLFKKFKFTKNKDNKDDIFVAKQNPYGASKKIQGYLKNYDLSKSMFNVNTDNKSPLKTKLSKHLSVDADSIVLFKNEFEAIKKIFTLFVPKYSNIFTLYPNSEFIEMLSNEMKFSIKYTIYTANRPSIQPKYSHILSNITPKTKLVYLSSPNSLTGQSIVEKQFVDFLDKLNDNIIVVVDQLFVDFVMKSSDNHFNPLKFLKKNVIVVRTFSNFYGFENLELSYVIADKEIAKLLEESNIIQNQTDHLSEDIASMCLEDEAYKKKIKSKIHSEKKRIYGILESQNIKYFPSETNYILLNPGKQKEEIYKELKNNNIIMEESDLHYNNYWAMPLSTKENNDKILDVLVSNF